MKFTGILKAAGIGLTVLLVFYMSNLFINRWMSRYAGILSTARLCGVNMAVFFLIGWLYGSFARGAGREAVSTVESALGGSVAAFLAGVIVAAIDVARYYLSATIHLTPSEYDFLLHGSGSLFIPLLVFLILLHFGLLIVGAGMGAAGGAVFAARVPK